MQRNSFSVTATATKVDIYLVKVNPSLRTYCMWMFAIQLFTCFIGISTTTCSFLNMRSVSLRFYLKPDNTAVSQFDTNKNFKYLLKNSRNWSMTVRTDKVTTVRSVQCLPDAGKARSSFKWQPSVPAFTSKLRAMSSNPCVHAPLTFRSCNLLKGEAWQVCTMFLKACKASKSFIF